MKRLYGDLLDQVAGRPVREVVAVMDHAAEVLARRAEHLNPDDRRLFVFALTARLSKRRMAELLQLPLSTVSRRLKKLHHLLTEPHIVQLLDGPCHLEPADRQIAIGYFLQRRSLKELAQQHDKSVEQIARRVAYFKGWMKGRQG